MGTRRLAMAGGVEVAGVCGGERVQGALMEGEGVAGASSILTL